MGSLYNGQESSLYDELIATWGSLDKSAVRVVASCTGDINKSIVFVKLGLFSLAVRALIDIARSINYGSGLLEEGDKKNG